MLGKKLVVDKVRIFVSILRLSLGTDLPGHGVKTGWLKTGRPNSIEILPHPSKMVSIKTDNKTNNHLMKNRQTICDEVKTLA